MASDTPSDDERDSDVDPWADIVADSLANDGDDGAFDFSTLDVTPGEPSGRAIDASLGPFDDVSDEATDQSPFADLMADDEDGESSPIGPVDAQHDAFAEAQSEGFAEAQSEAFVDAEHDAFAEARSEAFAEVLDDAFRDEAFTESADEPLDVFAEPDGSLDAADESAEASTASPELSVFAPDDAAPHEALASFMDPQAGFDAPFDAGDVEGSGAADEESEHGAFPSEVAEDDDDAAFGWAQVEEAFAGDGDAEADTAEDMVSAGADGMADDESEASSPWDEDVAAAVTDEDGEAMPAFDAASIGGAAAVAASAVGEQGGRAVARRPQPKKSGKKGGLGQLIGIVLGGALSIPIVIGILIGLMWMGRPDPIGLRKWLPGASFLLPPARQVARAGNGEPRPRNLDELSGGASDAGDAPRAPTNAVEPTSAFGGTDGEAAVQAVAAAAVPVGATPPQGDGDDQPSADLLAAIPAMPAPDRSPLPPDPIDLAGAGDAAPAAVVPMEAEPEPLDLAQLDLAIDAAAEAEGALVETAEDDPERRRRMVEWYRSLSRVAEELAAVEAVAVESGRPFEEASVRLDTLVTGIALKERLAGDLARLARNWLSFARRDSDGVVLPVTFHSTRPVGPYWCSKVLIDEADGETREVAIVSRHAPFAELGEQCLVTGVVFDGGTVWAADVRSLAAARDAGVVDRARGDAVPADEVPVPIVPEPDLPKFDLPKLDLPEVGLPEIDAPVPDAPKVDAPEVDEGVVPGT